MKNSLIANMFDRIANILELKGEIPFKINAYRNASRSILNLNDDIETIWKAGKLHTIPGIGEGLAKKIDEYLNIGKMTKFEEIVQSVPEDLIELLRIQNLGPKTLSQAYKKLGVKNLEDLKRSIKTGQMRNLPGMGAKKIDNINRGINIYEKGLKRLPLGIALPLTEELIHHLSKHPKVKRIFPAGSIRRMKETVGDIDILAETDSGEEIIQAFISLPIVKRVLAAGKTKGSVHVEHDYQVDLRAIPRISFGAALQYFTGSQAHNVRIREIAKKQGLKINEYGVFRGNTQIGGEKEEDIYVALGLPWIPPELREEQGEFEAAKTGRLPGLVDLFDINGDLHLHTRWSDGNAGIKDMAQKAETLGYSYLAICDHSQSAGYAGGLTPEQLLKQIQEIRNINKRMNHIKILAGSEVDIRTDGSLDFPDEILDKLDIVIASIHSGFKQRVTERLIGAANNPYVTIIAHPTGRLISQRDGYDVDMEAVMKTCAQSETALEINAWFERLDLNDINARRANNLGVRIAINTDAHSTNDMEAMRLGIGVARRAWLENKDVLNCFPIEEIIKKEK
jgi:DNA polymerase (family 10)